MNPARYSTVAKDLMQAIASGRYPVGSLLPTEFGGRDGSAPITRSILAALAA